MDDAEEASLSVSAICEMAAVMDETYGKIMRIPKHLYGEYYLHEKAKHDARQVKMRHEGWKRQEWDETFDSLKDRLVHVVAAFLTVRPLRFSPRPKLWEIEAVQMELVRRSLPSDFAYCKDFKEMCAKFRKFNWWEGHIMKLDYDSYGKYLLQNCYKMTKEERQAFFDLDIMVELINEDIAKLMPKEEQEELAECATDQQMKKTIEKLVEEGTLKNLYDYTWIMSVMNETQGLPDFHTPSSLIAYLKDLHIERLPSEDSINRKQNTFTGTFPDWTFIDCDTTEAKRRINVGKRFLNIFRAS